MSQHKPIHMAADHDKLMKAESFGKHLAQHIKGRFKYRKV